MTFVYQVPGFVPAIAQDGPMTCWATVYTMLISWKKGLQMPIREAVAQVAPKYGEFYDKGLKSNANPRGLPSSEFGPFLQSARMNHQPMKNLPIDEWLNLLKSYGLLWIGTLNAIGPGGGLHSRIICAISGGGNPDDTQFGIVDPDGGKRYFEPFSVFIAKYEGALALAEGQYLQIRHF